MRSTRNKIELFRFIAMIALTCGSLAAQIPVPKPAVVDQTCIDAAQDGINWAPDIKTAMVRAKKLDRPVFIVFLCRFMGDCTSPLP